VNSSRKLFNQLAALDTEQDNPASSHIDTASPLEIAQMMNHQDALVAKAVGGKLQEIARGIGIISEAFKSGGRLFYAGSGTSGRIGILDASECPPTFGSPPEMVQGLIAGGAEAIFKAKEGAEDDPENGAADIIQAGVGKNDVVCGIAASGRTPYVLGAVSQAKQLEAKTIFLCCVDEAQLKPHPKAAVTIAIPVGPEVISGSTRLKSGTAQKMVCNMLTTGAMIQLGKVYENVMVDLQLSNLKLHERAKRIIMKFTGFSYSEAAELLEQSDYHVKTALVMALKKVDIQQAQDLLHTNHGFVRSALLSTHKKNQ